MKKRILSLLLIGAMTCSMLVGCGTSNNTTEAPKEGTTLENNKVNDTTETEETKGTEETTETISSDIVLNDNTTVREVKDGYIKEIQNNDGTSYYKVAYASEQVTGTSDELDIEFQSISNLGSWTSEGDDSGVWRYINGDDGDWVTALVWGGGQVSDMTIDTINFEDIKAMLGSMNVYQDTLTTRKTDKYAAATVKVDRVDAGLSGYVTIIDNLETSMRWIVQFLQFTDDADYEMLENSAKSVTLGSDFSIETLAEEAKVSPEPYVVENTDDGTQTSTESESVEESTEAPAEK